ncbi:MAG: UDP-N-acetylglucosamine 2-epimerase (non-hydrolyzing), partial [Candidatus Kuenenia stuttgartiensis]|nr:UDP-N-acetylglucosamine 2-epimerase (non-hydrolyzing) [Candidatus Kuenenia stuttgartiensis]
ALEFTVEKVKNNPGYKLDLKIKEGKIVLITSHRRENFGQGFENICSAIKKLSEKYPDFGFVYPVHLNPNVQQTAYRLLAGLPNVYLIAPLDYISFAQIMSEAYLILTDSGGIQEEAPTLGIPVLVMRDTTERPEAIEAGTSKLVGTNEQAIINNVSLLIENKNEYEKMSKFSNPYGDGQAAQRIVDHILA